MEFHTDFENTVPYKYTTMHARDSSCSASLEPLPPSIQNEC